MNFVCIRLILNLLIVLAARSLFRMLGWSFGGGLDIVRADRGSSDCCTVSVRVRWADVRNIRLALGHQMLSTVFEYDINSTESLVVLGD